MKLKLQEADAEANELKQLLAAANDSVNEAREAALAAEDELQEKDKKLEESLQQLFQSEKELRLATDKLSRLEDQVSSSADKVNTEQVEVLLGQVAAAEAHLESERRERTIAEEELKRIMAEKQRALVQEAEDKLAGLKKEILDIMSSRSSAEAEAYSLRQEMEDLQDQNKRLEAKALEADLLRQSEKRLKDQVSELSEARLALQAELACAKQELASRSKHSEREVVEAIAELSRVKSECYAAKQESIDLEEDVKRLVKENSSSTREVRLLREKSANLDATVFKLEEENHELMYRLRKLEADKIQEQENVETETKRLQSRITELESSIKRKDTRIQKLEAVKLTKEKCKAIERITASEVQCSTKSRLMLVVNLTLFSVHLRRSELSS
jgi:chromosome segregation ATPase